MRWRIKFQIDSDHVFYDFLYDPYFNQSRCYWVKEALRKLHPHYLWNCPDLVFSDGVSGCGKKTEEAIRQIMEEYREKSINRYGKRLNFCDCGEPLLAFYKHCPICGKEAE